MRTYEDLQRMKIEDLEKIKAEEQDRIFINEKERQKLIQEILFLQRKKDNSDFYIENEQVTKD